MRLENVLVWTIYYLTEPHASRLKAFIKNDKQTFWLPASLCCYTRRYCVRAYSLLYIFCFFLRFQLPCLLTKQQPQKKVRGKNNHTRKPFKAIIVVPDFPLSLHLCCRFGCPNFFCCEIGTLQICPQISLKETSKTKHEKAPAFDNPILCTQ